MKPKLVPDARDWWRWISVRCMALAIALETAWVSLPPDLIGYIPDHVRTWLTFAILVFGIAGRLVDQPKRNLSNKTSGASLG